MLQFIRDNATGWIAWGIVILVCIPFALWGIHQYVAPNSSVAIAVVDGAEIGYYEFQRRYAQRRQQLQSMFGASVNELESERLRREVLEQMIDSEVIIQSGRAVGLRVGDKQLADTIREQSVFQTEGSFSQTAYDNWLRSQGYSPGKFEEDFRRSVFEQQIRFGISGSGFITKSELSDAARIRQQRRTFLLLTILAADFEGTTPEPMESEIAAHFEQHRARYVTPERLRLRYVELSAEDIAAGIKVDDEELQALFDAERERFVTPEKRDISHILISVAAGADEEVEEQARERLATLRERIVAGALFEDVAKEHSDDHGSASSGGALGFTERGIMDPAFEEAAFTLTEDQVSDPVRSSFGWHLIKVASIQQADTATFESVRDQVLEQYQTREAERIYAERAEILANVSYEHPESLEISAEELDLEIRETEYVTRDGISDDSIALQPAVVAAAFSSDVLNEGNNSEPIEFEFGRIVVVRVFDHEAQRSLELDEARAEIIEELHADAVRSAVVERGRELLARLRGGQDPDAVATDAGAAWEQFESVDRFSNKPSQQLLEVVFRMPHPESDVAQIDGTVNDNGDFNLVLLAQVDDGSVTLMSDDEKSSLRQTLESDFGQTMFAAFVRSRRESADVQIIEQN